MRTIQCAHLPHQCNGFVVTCRLWTTSSGVANMAAVATCSPKAACYHKAIALMRRMDALDYLHDFIMYVLHLLLCAC